jgi:hypothetical protein
MTELERVHFDAYRTFSVTFMFSIKDLSFSSLIDPFLIGVQLAVPVHPRKKMSLNNSSLSGQDISRIL